MGTVLGSTVFFSGGQNAGFDPAAIGETQYALGLNIACRGGSVSTRPSFNPIDLDFGAQTRMRREFLTGKFQGSKWYSTASGGALIVVVSGRLFWIDPLTRIVSRLLPTETHQFSARPDRCYFQQVERYFVIQDGINKPVILDGQEAREADTRPDGEVPVGTCMAYGHGRLFVQTGQQTFMAGDVYYPGEPESVLKFTETNLLDGGGVFAFPARLGKLMSLRFLAGYDTSTGDGPLMAFGEGGSMSYAVYKPRKDWFAIDLAKQQLEGNGPVGADALAYASDDLVYFSRGGLRSVSVLRAPATDPRRFVNMSLEMSNVEKLESPSLAPLMSMVFFDNRLLYTQVGRKAQARALSGDPVDDWYFAGLASLDFAQMDSTVYGQRGYSRSLAFDGYWTGPRPTQILTDAASSRCFVFGKLGNGDNCLYELLPTTSGFDGEQPIFSRLVTRSFAAKDANGSDLPFFRKMFRSMQAWVREFSGSVPLAAFVSFDGHLGFTQVGSTVLNAPVQTGDVPVTDVYQVGEPQSRPHLVFTGDGMAGCVPGAGTPELTGYIGTTAWEWQGYLVLARVLAMFDTVADPVTPSCVAESGQLAPLPLPDKDVTRTLFIYSCDRGVNYDAI